MGLFGQSSPFEADVEKATAETNTTENWSFFLDVCDKVTTNPNRAKDCLKVIMKRMGHTDPHVVMQAITLLDACVSNCGKPFHLEIASREFETEYRRLLKNAQPKIATKMLQVLKKWSENEFKNDHQLNLIPTLCLRLQNDGYEFSSNVNDKTQKQQATMKAIPATKDVNRKKEEEDLAKAIELSLKEAATSNSPKKQIAAASVAATTTYPTLYPSFTGVGAAAGMASNTNTNIEPSASSSFSSATNAEAPEARKVRALYDFEEAEENELTFFAGEIIHVTDDSDANWWKGYNQRGEGLFPSNFVTADLSLEPERFDNNQQQQQKLHKSALELEEKELQKKTETAAPSMNSIIEVDESKIDRLLHLLNEANPEDATQDTEEMLRLEEEVHQMGPLIDAELERVDRKHAHLTQLSVDLVDAINLYHSLMRDDRAHAAGFVSGGAGMVASGMPPLGMSYYHHNQQQQQQLYGAGYAGVPAAVGVQPTPSLMGPNYAVANTSSAQLNSSELMSSATALASNAPPQAAAAGMIYAAPSMQSHLMSRQYQNGGGSGVQMPPLTAPLPSMPPHIYGMAAQQPSTIADQQQNYQMLPVTPQQQQMQTLTGNVRAATAGTNGPQQQQQQQFLPPQQILPYMQQQQQQQQQQQFLQMSNGTSTFMLPPINASSNINNNNNLHQQQHAALPGSNEFSQLQQQMTVLSMAGNNSAANVSSAALHQPVTQSFLVQSQEAKNNIPIYQQQR